MYRICRIVLMAGLMALAGCAVASNSVVKSSRPDAGVSVREGSLYVYTFLDLREAYFGADMLTALNRQLVEKLAAGGVKTKVLTFMSTDAGRYFPNTGASADVPVEKVIAGNRAEETVADARYRLVVFPLTTRMIGAWFIYDLRWELIDGKTDHVVWTVKTHGRHLALWSRNEMPDDRAALIVDDFIAEMKKSGLL